MSVTKKLIVFTAVFCIWTVIVLSLASVVGHLIDAALLQ